MQVLTHSWQKYMANDGDSVGKTVFCSSECVLSNSIIVLFVSVVSMEVNKRYCNLHITAHSLCFTTSCMEYHDQTQHISCVSSDFVHV